MGRIITLFSGRTDDDIDERGPLTNLFLACLIVGGYLFLTYCFGFVATTVLVFIVVIPTIVWLREGAGKRFLRRGAGGHRPPRDDGPPKL